MLKVLHGADFHLDSPFSGLKPDAAARRRGEQRELLARLTDLAREREADLVLLSGDLLDGDLVFRETVQALARALKYNLDRRAKMMDEALAFKQLDVSHYDMLPRLLAQAGYSDRDNDKITLSRNPDGSINNNRVTTQERRHATSSLSLSWSMLDLGVGYYNTVQQAERVQTEAERRSKAQEAAQAVHGRLVLPTFTTGVGTDFNDLHQSEGLPEVRRQLGAVEHVEAHAHGQHLPSLVSLDMGEFLSMPIPERGFLLSPVLPVQGIGIMYAPRGVGKTFAALSVAVAVASGGAVFNWRAPMPKKTLYVDGEMPATSMQSRLTALVSGMSVPPLALKNLALITPDLQPCPMPDLSTMSGQMMLEPFLKGVDMLVLDNIATLCRTGKENESQSWQTMQAWLLELRRRGITVLLIHHAGKSGDQRGTSAREDIMDTVISLRRPREYSMAEGARFEVHLTKARGILGDDAKPFEANLVTEGNVLQWHIKELEDVELEELKRLLSEGYSVRDCAEEMGKSKSAIHRLKRKLDE